MSVMGQQFILSSAPRQAIQELFCSGKDLRRRLEFASITLPLENSMPRCLTNSMNIPHAEHRFRRI